jgi:hypothetical protein
VRVRPLNQDEIDNHGTDSAVSIEDTNNSLTVFNAETRKQFSCAFDRVLGWESCQEDVYAILQTCTQSVTSGFNSTIFAYGESRCYCLIHLLTQSLNYSITQSLIYSITQLLNHSITQFHNFLITPLLTSCFSLSQLLSYPVT